MGDTINAGSRGKFTFDPSSIGPQYFDPFAETYNRSFLAQFIPPILNEITEKNCKATLFMIDIDDFKQINDTYGHLVGDQAIKNVASIFKHAIRDNDYVIRYAGDEFVILLTDTNLEISYKTAERIMEKVRSSQFSFNNQTVKQTISMGFALFPDDADVLEGLIERADQALYLAKKRGKNNFAYYKEVSVSQISLKIAMDAIPCPKFIDREKEMALIRHGIDDAVGSSKSGGVVVFGESGIGKSRMLKEISQYSQGKGIQVLSSNTHQKNSLVPSYLLARIFDNYAKNQLVQNKDNFLSLLSGIEQDKRNLLCNSIPALKEITKSNAEVTKDPDVIFEAYWALLKTIISKSAGVFLAIDNIQYADLLSLKFFDFILTKGKNEKIFFFLTVLDPFPVGVYNPSAVREIISNLVSGAKVKTIKLGVFSENETEQVINAVFPDINKLKSVSKIIFGVTRGHPFFIEELLKYLIEKSLVYFENNKWEVKEITKESLPKSLEEVISQRIRGLDADVKEIVLISSVIGEDINPEILSKIKLSTKGNILEILDKARKLKIIKEEENGFGFLNDIIKETTLKEIDPSQQKDISSKVSEALMDLYKDNLETVSFQLGNIFSKSEDAEKLNKFIRTINEKTSQIFDPTEILHYLEDLTKATEEEERIVQVDEIKDEDFPLVIEFLRLLQGALKDAKLYPKGSRIRELAVRNVYDSLILILAKYETITISEVEKSLVVNKRRVTAKLAKFIDIEYIVKFLIERDIKSFSLMKEITKEEMECFVETIILEAQEIYAQGRWKDILAAKQLSHVSVNKAIYVLPQSSRFAAPMKEKLESALILDFILGKASGKELGNIKLMTILKDNPQLLSEQLLKAAEVAKDLDKYGDKIDILSKGMEKIVNLAEETSKTGNKSQTEENKVEVDKKLVDVFMNFNPKIKVQLARKSGASDNFILSALQSLDKNSIGDFLKEAFDSEETLWSLSKLMSKLKEVYKEPSKEFKEILDSKIKDKSFSEEETKIITGDVLWKDLPLERKISDICKMDKDVLMESLDDDLGSIIEQILLSGNLKQLGDLFVCLRRKSLEAPQTVGIKVQAVFINIFKSFYTAEDKKKIVFDALEVLLSSIKIDIGKEGIDFSLGLISSVITELNLNRFKRKGEYEKLKVFYDIYKFIEENKTYIGEEGVNALKQKLNLEGLAIELFNFYIEGVITSLQSKDVENIVQYFSLLFLDEIITGLSEKLAKVADPFEKFLIIRRLQKFIFSFDKDNLERFSSAVFGVLQFDDVCDMLSYAKKGDLVETLRVVYFKSDEKGKERVLSLIYRLKLIEAKDFVENLTKADNPHQLHKIITEILTEFKK
ncbi:MAG: diguanylate cyclase [Candidatus Omnitrophota bacterium]|jgi:diguanylate cyclase (GGDEF)-like protein